MSDQRPNIVFIMSDDHAAHAISAYGSQINRTPHMDRLAAEGLRLDQCFCTNSICAPSRATILTGLYSHKNGVETLNDKFDGRQRTFPKLLQAAGYQTALVGKWHLGHGGDHDPTGFDYWNVLPGQGDYHNPVMITPEGRTQHQGYVTDLITDFALDWLAGRRREDPFCLLLHHKAPHRRWEPDDKHADLYEDGDIPEPSTFNDDYANRAAAAKAARMTIEHDLTPEDLKQDPPAGLSGQALKQWKYQRYIKDYLRCVASVDDNVGRVLDYLDAEGLRDNTIVVYTSDQGFFLGDHGWYDKRFMYEESLRMPFLIRYPAEIAAGSVDRHIVLNTDFAPTLLDYCGLDEPDDMDGRSARQLLSGSAPEDWRQELYYRYFMHLAHHNVYAHYGLRDDRYKLIYYYEEAPEPPEWELFDLKADPSELNNVVDDPAYAAVVADMRARMLAQRAALGDCTNTWPEAG